MQQSFIDDLDALTDVPELRRRLREAEDTLRAIQSGEIDALVITSAGGSSPFVLNTLIDQMNEGAVTLSADGVIFSSNRRFAEMMGLSLESLLRTSFRSLVVEYGLSRFDELLRMADSGPARGELGLLSANSEEIPIQLSLSPVSTGSGPVICAVVVDQSESRSRAEELELKVEERTHALGRINLELEQSKIAALNMMEDTVMLAEALKESNEILTQEIEHRRTAEDEVRRLNAELEQRVLLRTAQLEAANRELEAFSYSVSHDLRAPLRAMEGFSRILSSRDLPGLGGEERDYLERIQMAAQRMSQLIDDLLSLFRIGQQNPQMRDCDLSEIARTVIQDLRETEDFPDAQIVISDDVRGYCDRSLLRIALHNLLGNAWKFAAKREQPRVEFGTADTDRGRAYFVRDNGVGFDPRQAGKLFVPFQRLHNAAEFEGTGIGLPIVQRVINRHGGAIWAESQINAGATFFFTLPDPDRRSSSS